MFGGERRQQWQDGWLRAAVDSGQRCDSCSNRQAGSGSGGERRKRGRPASGTEEGAAQYKVLAALRDGGGNFHQ